MIINDSDLIVCLIPIVASWITTIIVMVWKFDKRITRNESSTENHARRIANCENTLQTHEKRIDHIEVQIHG